MYMHTYIREREIGEREAWGGGGGEGGQQTHKGDKGERRKEKRERTMSAD